MQPGFLIKLSSLQNVLDIYIEKYAIISFNYKQVILTWCIFYLITLKMLQYVRSLFFVVSLSSFFFFA